MLEWSTQEVMYSSKTINPNYMEFVGYVTCEKLISTSSECSRITHKISKQGIPKTNITKVYPSSTIEFWFFPT